MNFLSVLTLQFVKLLLVFVPETANVADVKSLSLLIFGAEFIYDSILFLFVSLHLPNLILSSLKFLFVASNYVFELFDMQETLTDLYFIYLSMVM